MKKTIISLAAVATMATNQPYASNITTSSDDVKNQAAATLSIKYPWQDIIHTEVKNTQFNNLAMEEILKVSDKVDKYQDIHYTDYLIFEYKWEKYITSINIGNAMQDIEETFKNNCIKYAKKNASNNEKYPTDDVYNEDGKTISFPWFDAEYEKCIN